MKKIIAISTFLLIGTVFLAGCGKQEILDEKTLQKVDQQQKQVQIEQQEQVAPEETIDFEDPGDDEIGKKVDQIDSLINSTSAGDYEDNLLGVEQE